jgi:multidrug efflux pump
MINLSAGFIKRPIATTLITAGIVLSGAVAFRFLPISPLPQVDFPTISVAATLPGASPEIMSSSVATPLERSLGTIAGVTEMTSSSFLGSTSITLQFDLSRDINGAARDVEAAINSARSFLPTNLPSNPSYRKVNPADAPIFILALTSSTYQQGELYDAASTILEQRLSQIQGVGQVTVGGSSLPAVRVELNPTQLNNNGIGLPDVAAVLKSQNANLPKGQLSDDHVTSDISTNDQLMKAAGYRGLIVGYHNGGAVKLSDVAEVDDSVQNLRSQGYLNGKPAVLVIIFRSPGANIIDTVDRIRDALPSLKASIPTAIETTVVMDRTTTIRASVTDVERTLLISIGLVIFVVFAFLRNVRATFIPSVAVPASLIGTFGVMYLLNYSLDNLSLMALTISTGFVVDDAIVVIENITRYLEQGMTPKEAALKGAQEIGFTVLSISISLIAVFIPILMMGGIVGRLFREFAVTLSIAIVMSLLISLTTTPMMCAQLLKKQKEEDHGKFFQWTEKKFNSLLSLYERSLSVVLKHPAVTLGVLAITIALNGFLYVKIPKGFFPQQDNGTVFGGIQGAQDISFAALNKLTKTFVERVKEDPAVQNVVAFIGGNGATNSGFMYLGLKPLEERKISSSNLIGRLRPKLMSLPGASVFLQAGQDVRIGGHLSSAQYQYTIQSENLPDLVTWGPKILQEMKKLPGFTDVNSDQQNNGLKMTLDYDRETAARLGITPQLIDSTLYNAFGQSLVSTLYTPLNQYYVVMEVAPKYWANPASLKQIYLHPAQAPGSLTQPMVPLNVVSEANATNAPLSVNHQGQYPSVTISFNLKTGVALSDASSAIEKMEQGIGIPPTIHGMFSGTLQAFQDSLSSEPMLILTALLAVYIVLGMLYESYVHPITILSTIPSAGVGAVLALFLFHMDLSVVALIGIILLIGIVKKNAILMIDFALAAEREQKMSPKDAIFQACLLRFRPILMTTLAALFGAMPLAFGTGVGSEMRQPLGVAIIGGLIFSQMLTLYTTPVVYLTLDRLRLRFANHHSKKSTLAVGAATATVLLLFAFSGCTTVGPKYDPPKMDKSAAANYKEAEPWKVATPEDAKLHGKWWEMYHDEQLNALEAQVLVNNQNIKAAFASLLQARAVVKEGRAGYAPTISVNPNVTTQKGPVSPTGVGVPVSSNKPFTEYSLPVDASWELDLWGRIRQTVEANIAAAQASAADLENEKLVEQSDLALYYYELRGQDALKQLYSDSVAAYQKSLDLTKALMKTGIDSDEAVAQAETQLEAAQAQATNLEIARGQYEHAIALLVGQSASSFSIKPEPWQATPPNIPLGVPSQLLERRPDIAAAERAMAQANAQIGIAMAAYFPTLTLSGEVGFVGSSLNNLLQLPNLFWSVGATLAETVYDGGLRGATVDQYRANYDRTVAVYRQTVLAAFQQVEDDLVSVRILRSEVQQQNVAVSSSQRALRIATERYRLGLDPYLNITTAQQSVLTNQQTATHLTIQQMTASVQLIEALGGGWTLSQLPPEKDF